MSLENKNARLCTEAGRKNDRKEGDEEYAKEKTWMGKITEEEESKEGYKEIQQEKDKKVEER